MLQHHWTDLARKGVEPVGGKEISKWLEWHCVIVLEDLLATKLVVCNRDGNDAGWLDGNKVGGAFGT